MVIVPHSSLSEASVHVYGASCPKNSPTHSSPCVSRDLCISLGWLLSLISFFFLSISVSFPPRTPRSTLLIVFVPLPSSLSAPNLFSLSLIIPLHLHTHVSSADASRAPDASCGPRSLLGCHRGQGLQGGDGRLGPVVYLFEDPVYPKLQLKHGRAV